MSAYGFGGMIQKLKKNPKTIVFTEGTDARILEAASRLLASNFLTRKGINNGWRILILTRRRRRSFVRLREMRRRS